MSNINNFIPEGVEDINYEQYEETQKLQNLISGVFKKSGCKQILTPTFEYYDLFAGLDMSIDKDQMYKIIDTNGKILVLRPDVTIPVARMVATNYEKLDEDLKYMYFANVFRSDDFRAGGKREFVQAGVEYFGNGSTRADADIIGIAIQALVSSGFGQLKVELGDAKYFNGLMEEIDNHIDKESIAQIKALVEGKNSPGLIQLLDGMDIDDRFKNVLVQLPFLYGPVVDTAGKAYGLALNETMKSAVDDVLNIYEQLSEKDFERFIYADLGLVNHLDYYSGMIFKIYIQNSGIIAGSGGRYDVLMEKFGRKIPATGFGLNMDILYEALQSDKMKDDILNIALGKGRLAEITMEKLEAIGVRFPEYNKSSRKLIFADETGTIRIVFVKAGDVDIYVEKGACDIGVAGKDTLMESSSDVYEMLDLGYGKCKFAIAALVGFEKKKHKKIRVATKYPNVAKTYFEKKGEPIEIIKINGSVELAPIMGLADVIVDIVETGTTLKENGLEIIEKIEDVSARLIVNRVSLKTKQESVSKIIDALRR